MHIDTSEYERTHGKAPRGYGRWGFTMDRLPDIFWYCGTYAVAKKTAITYAREHGHTSVTVCD